MPMTIKWIALNNLLRNVLIDAKIWCWLCLADGQRHQDHNFDESKLSLDRKNSVHNWIERHEEGTASSTTLQLYTLNTRFFVHSTSSSIKWTSQNCTVLPQEGLQLKASSPRIPELSQSLFHYIRHKLICNNVLSKQCAVNQPTSGLDLERGSLFKRSIACIYSNQKNKMWVLGNKSAVSCLKIKNLDRLQQILQEDNQEELALVMKNIFNALQ